MVRLFWVFYLLVLRWLFSIAIKRYGFARFKVQKTEMSSLATFAELSDTNFNALQLLPDTELLSQLEKSTLQMDESPYALNPEQIEMIDQKIYNNPKYKEDLPVYTQISDDGLKVEFEDAKDPKVCAPARLYYEKQITSSSLLRNMIANKPSESPILPKKCVTHIMNKMSLAKSSTGYCASSSGSVRIPGAKPCVTENLVNMTYNSFVDVMECLNLNPKLFLPKIARESGFLINAYGAGKDGGIGQLTGIAIEAVNNDYAKYLNEIEKAASTKPSCARIMKYKSLLTKASAKPEQRCSMIGLPENPLRNILYLGIFNRANMDHFSGVKFVAGQDVIEHGTVEVPVTNDAKDEFEGVAKANGYKEALEQLGIKEPNMHFFKDVITLASYNMGSPTALRLFSKYLEKRKLAKKPLTSDDFNFNKVRLVKDVYGDGTEKNAIDVARSFVMSSFISRKDKAPARAIKLRKRKQLPKEWASSYLKSFPEFLALNANSYDGKQISRYSVYGAPGYVSYVADQNRELREVFTGSGIDPDYCSDPNFLVFR